MNNFWVTGYELRVAGETERRFEMCVMQGSVNCWRLAVPFVLESSIGISDSRSFGLSDSPTHGLIVFIISRKGVKALRHKGYSKLISRIS